MIFEQLIASETKNEVPNEVKACDYAIVGEAPGKDEESQGRPFVGASGGLLFAELSKLHVARYECSVMNVSQIRPDSNNFNLLTWDGPAVQDGIRRLEYDLGVAKPRIVICLGNAALHVMKHGNVAPERTTKGYKWPSSISNWRGSVFMSPWGYKCIAAYHPAYIFRSYGDIAYFRADLAKAVREAKIDGFEPPHRTLFTEPSLPAIVSYLDRIKTTKPRIAVDIEGGMNTFSCISVALSPTEAFIVPFTHADGTAYWSLEDECELWRALASVLCDPTIPKVLQNCLYDYFVLGYCYRTPIRGIVDDTMLKFWELLPELEKGLGVQASLLTNEPYYKDARATTGLTLWKYCCTDSAVTYEINEKLDKELSSADAQRHYRFNMSLLPPTLYMQTIGFGFDTKRRDEMLAEVRREAYTLQHEVNVKLGKSLSGLSQSDVVQRVAVKCCHKKLTVSVPSDLCKMPRADYVGNIHRVAYLVTRYHALEAHELGELEAIVECGINVDSSKQMQVLLYDELKLPKQFKKEHGRRTESVTADALAVLTLYTQLKERSDPRADFVLSLLKLRGLYDRVQNMQYETDPDGRVRATYNVVGSETGRFTCYDGMTKGVKRYDN